MIRTTRTSRVAVLVAVAIAMMCLMATMLGRFPAYAALPTGNDGASSPVTAQASKGAHVYKVVFKANGGKLKMGAQSLMRGKTAALKANKFKRKGYKFVGWNTKKNGKGKAIANKAMVKDLAKAGKTVKLYAQWKRSANVRIWLVTSSRGHVVGGEWYFMKYRYNKNGLLKCASDAEDRIYSYTYDNVGNPQTCSLSQLGDDEPYATGVYSLDKRGYVIGLTGTQKDWDEDTEWVGSWKRSYSYNKKGRLKKYTETVDGEIAEQHRYAYDKKGRVKTEKEYVGKSKVLKTTCRYDARGGLAKEKNRNKYEVSYRNSYRKGRLIKQVAYLNCTITYKYKKVMVPRSLAKLVKAQQRVLVPRRYPEFQTSFATLPIESVHK